MAFQKAHGLTIAQNGFIEHLVVESLSSDPTLVDAGRFWFNETEKQLKFSTLDGGGGVIVRTIKDKEDYDAFVASIESTASGSSGASVVGYDGQTGANGQLSIGTSDVAAALDTIVTNVDQAMQDIDSLTGGGSGSIASLQAELDATQTGAGLNADGTYIQPTGSNYLNSSTSIQNAVLTLDTRAKANADAITAESTARQAADALKVDLAGATMGGSLDFAATYKVTGLAEPTDPSDAATKNYVDAFSAGLDPKESARCATTENIDLTTGGLLTVDGVNVAAGNRVLVRAQTDPTQNGIYDVVSGGAWTRSTDFDGTPSNEVSGGSFCFVEEGTAYANSGFVVQFSGNVVVGTDNIVWVQFSGAGEVIAGAGISKTGNELYLNFGAGIMQLPTNEIGIDLYGPGGLWLTDDGVSESTAADSQIGIKLADGTLAVDGNGLRLSDATNNTLTGLQSELDNTQAGAGLGTGGAYSADGTSTYITTATSLANADSLLDDQLKTVTDGLATEVTNRTNADTAIQAELDATQAGAGLSSAGAYTAPASNYLGGSANIVAGMVQLDTAVKANADDISAEQTARASAVSAESTARTNADSAIQAEVDAIEAAMGSAVSTAGAYVAFSGTNYINGNTSVSEDLTDLDTAVKTVSDDLAAAIGGGSGTTLNSLQDEVDAVETASGGIFSATGVYSAFSGTNYIDGNSNLAEDLTDLDTQMKTNSDTITANQGLITGLQTELDATQVGAGLGTAGAYTVDTLSNYMKSTDFSAAGYTASLYNADRLLDTALKAEVDARTSQGTSLQTEVDNIETAMGAVVAADGTYVPFTGLNYINGNTSVSADLTDLDAAIKSVSDSLSTEVTNRQNHVAQLASDVNNAVNGLVYTFTSASAATQHVVTHSLNNSMIDVSVWVKDDDLLYRNDLVGVTITDANTVTVDLTESREIKCIVRSTTALALTGAPPA